MQDSIVIEALELACAWDRPDEDLPSLLEDNLRCSAGVTAEEPLCNSLSLPLH